MNAHARHLFRSLAIAFVVVAAAVLATALDASAYVTAGGSGSASAGVTTLAAPAITRATAGSGSVALTWSSVTPPGTGTVSYYVSRDGGAAGAACPSAASPSAVTSCTDTGVATGSHQYTVTAVWRTWTRTSASVGATVAVGAATQLVFTAQPGGGATGGTAFPNQPVVTARDASNNAVTDYSGTVSLSIARGGASGATLSGCTGTLRNGVTTFAGCKIDKNGSNYVLHASDGTLGADSSSFSVAVGAAAQLLFTGQPGGGATGGTAFPNQPEVTIADAGGNTVSSSSTITLGILSGTGTAGASLGSCNPTKAKSGVASFDSCEIDLAGTGYQLHASVSGGLSGDSAAFDVSVGAVTRLQFTTQPGGGATVHAAFPTQPVVTAQDAGGNAVTSYSRTVTLSITSHTGASGATLSGCRGTLANGATTFSGCQLDKVASDYQLHASDSSRSTDSDAFAVAAGPAAQLVLSTPSGASGGTAFSSQPSVTALDAFGNTATGYAGTVTLAIRSGPAGAVLSGCTSALRSGVVSFSGCKLDRAGSYVLVASDGTLTDDSGSFTVSVGSTAALLFTTQPGGAVAGVVFTTQPVVTAVDAGGNTVTGYNGTVSLSLLTGNGSLSGCSSSRSNGVTTFSGCKISRSGTGDVLRAGDGTRSVNSAAFDVS